MVAYIFFVPEAADFYIERQLNVQIICNSHTLNLDQENDSPANAHFELTGGTSWNRRPTFSLVTLAVTFVTLCFENVSTPFPESAPK